MRFGDKEHIRFLREHSPKVEPAKPEPIDPGLALAFAHIINPNYEIALARGNEC